MKHGPRLEAVLKKAGLKSLPRIAGRVGARGTAIVGAALLDHLLEQVLRQHMVAKPEETLFATYGPLSSFSAKIDLAKSLGILTKGEASDLHRVRKIRNAFAHSLEELSFRDPSIQTHVHQLQVRARTIIGKKGAPRFDFEVCILVLSGFLLGRIDPGAARPEPADFLGTLASFSRQKQMPGSRSGSRV